MKGYRRVKNKWPVVFQSLIPKELNIYFCIGTMSMPTVYLAMLRDDQQYKLFLLTIKVILQMLAYFYILSLSLNAVIYEIKRAFLFIGIIKQKEKSNYTSRKKN